MACPGSFGNKHLFDKQEVVSMGVGRRNDRTKWQSKELLIVVSLEWADMFSGSHMRPAEDTCPLAGLRLTFHSAECSFCPMLDLQWFQSAPNGRQMDSLHGMEKRLILRNVSSLPLSR